MIQALQRILPAPILKHILHFDRLIEERVAAFAQRTRGLVLDAGAGESRHAHYFPAGQYIGVDLAVGDVQWDYSGLAAVSDLAHLPFADSTFDAALNIVTLEHVPDPQRVLGEIARVLKPGGRLLLIAPHEWEEHQVPHDFYRYTRYGLRHLLETAGLRVVQLEPAGGYFRLLQRRLAGSLQFFPAPLAVLVGLALLPAVLLLPLLDPLDTEKRFTLGFIVEAEKC